MSASWYQGGDSRKPRRRRGGCHHSEKETEKGTGSMIGKGAEVHQYQHEEAIATWTGGDQAWVREGEAETTTHIHRHRATDLRGTAGVDRTLGRGRDRRGGRHRTQDRGHDRGRRHEEAICGMEVAEDRRRETTEDVTVRRESYHLVAGGEGVRAIVAIAAAAEVEAGDGGDEDFI